MSDTSVIMGGVKGPGGNGDWARDSTLQKILGALGSTATTQATNTAGVDQNTRAQTSLKQKLDTLPYEVRQVLTNGLGPGGSVFGTLAVASKSLGGIMENASVKSTLMTGILQTTGTALIGLSYGAKLAQEAFEKFFQTDKLFTEIYGSGVRLRGGLQGLITSSSDAGLSINDFSSLMTRNSTTVAAFAGRDVPKLIKSFQDSTQSGGEFIMSLQENAETFLQTAEIYKQAGIAGSLTNDQLVASSRRLIGEITKTSEATGMSRKSLLDFVGSITKSGQAYLLLSTFSKQAGENFVNASTQLAKFGQQGGKLLSDNIQKYFAGGKTFGLLDDSMLKLVATVPGLGASFENMAEASLKGGDAAEQAQKDFAKTLIGAPVALRQQLLAAMPEIAGTLGDLIQNAERVQKAEKEREETIIKEAKRRKVDEEVIRQEYAQREKDDKARASSVQEFNKQINAFNNEIYRVYVGLAETLMPALNVLTASIKFVSDTFVSLDKGISSFFGSKAKDQEGEQTSTGALGSLLLGGGLLYAGAKVSRGVLGAIRRRRAAPTSAPGAGLGDLQAPGAGLTGLAARGNTPDKPIFVQSVNGPSGSPDLSGVLGSGGAPGAGGTASRGGRLGGLLKGAGRLLGKAFLPLSLAMGAFDAFQGFGADPSASFGGKLLNAGSSALSGATFGLLGSSPADIAARASGQGTAPGGQAAGQLSLLDQIDQMLSNRPDGLNLQYSETGQALRDFSSGYREMINALSLSPAGGLDTARGLLNLVAPQAPAAVAPAYQAANDWQMEVVPIWKKIQEHNEVMVSLLIKIAGDIGSLGTPPVQASGMLPG